MNFLFSAGRRNLALFVLVVPIGSSRGDGDRGQTKGLTREEGQRGGAQLEAGNGEDFKGGKRLRGRGGGTVKGKRPKGAGSPG